MDRRRDGMTKSTCRSNSCLTVNRVWNLSCLDGKVTMDLFFMKLSRRRVQCASCYEADLTVPDEGRGGGMGAVRRGEGGQERV